VGLPYCRAPDTSLLSHGAFGGGDEAAQYAPEHHREACEADGIEDGRLPEQ